MTAAAGVQGNRALTAARRLIGSQEGILLILLIALIIGTAVCTALSTSGALISEAGLVSQLRKHLLRFIGR